MLSINNKMLSLMIHVGDEGSACDRKKYNPLNPVMYSFAILLPSTYILHASPKKVFYC